MWFTPNCNNCGRPLMSHQVCMFCVREHTWVKKPVEIMIEMPTDIEIPAPKPKKEEQPLYDEARSYFAEVQEGQIEKGRKKYPADLNEDNWTALDLIDHAMQEAVDQIHYLTALRRKIRKL